MNKPTSKEDYSELKTVESQRNTIYFEEFPEGPYGAATNEQFLGKATGWEDSQHSTNVRFDYENHELHLGMERGYPGSDSKNDQPDLFE